MTDSLRLTDFRCALPGAPVIGPISLEVAAGEVLALLGPSGAGKTTLLRAMAGLVPAAGGLAVAGTDRSGAAPESRGIVYLHQTPRLFPHLDVLGNVAFPMRLRRLPEPAVRDRATALLDLVQLGPLATRRTDGLSGGERQRVALARALAAEPRVLLLDEPFAALDPGLRAEVRAALEAVLQAAQLATVLVTHDLEEAGWLAHRAGVLLEGSLVQLAPPIELFEAPASMAVATFLEIPNRWTIGEAASMGLDAPPGAHHVALHAAAIRATADAAGRAIVERILPAREHLRLVVEEAGVRVMAESVGPAPRPGARVALTVQADRAIFFNSEGRRIAPG
jgi:ABC-type sulfate/molybdate transport systems ATPase subunit